MGRDDFYSINSSRRESFFVCRYKCIVKIGFEFQWSPVFLFVAFLLVVYLSIDCCYSFSVGHRVWYFPLSKHREKKKKLYISDWQRFNNRTSPVTEANLSFDFVFLFGWLFILQLSTFLITATTFTVGHCSMVLCFVIFVLFVHNKYLNITHHS